MTNEELERINSERRRMGRPILTRAQAELATTSPRAPDRNSDGSVFGSPMMDFLIGYSGIPVPSGMGMAGYISSPSSPVHTDYSSGTYGSQSSSDTGSSSSYSSDSSSSSSSSSSDSGSSSGGGE